MEQPVAATGGDAVVGVFDRSRLSSALAATHRAGFGPHARVLDGARGDLAGQLRRAGLRVSLPAGGDADTVLIVVAAPGRAAAVAQIFTRAGALAVHDARRGTTSPLDAPAPPAPSIPIGGATLEGDAGATS